jgi:hypothetical protein
MSSEAKGRPESGPPPPPPPPPAEPPIVESSSPESNDRPEAALAEPPVAESSSSSPPSSIFLLNTPYIRVRLQTAAVAMPRALQNSHAVSSDEWNAFWKQQVKPIALQVERYTVVFAWTVGVLAVLSLASLCFIAAWVMPVTGNRWSLAWYGILLVLLVLEVWALCAWNGRVRAQQLQALRAVTKAQESKWWTKCQLTFEVEYESELALENSGRFHLYLIPSANQFPCVESIPIAMESHPDNNVALLQQPGGYLRIRLFDAGILGGWSWTPISLPHLETLCTLPSPLLQQATADNTHVLTELWTSFWLDLVAQSRDHLWGHRILRVSLVVWIVYIVSFSTLMHTSWYSSNVSLVVSLLVLLLVLYGSSRVHAATNCKRTLVQRHAPLLAAHGVFLDYKTIHEFAKYGGSSVVHCLDVFPLSVWETRMAGEV